MDGDGAGQEVGRGPGGLAKGAWPPLEWTAVGGARARRCNACAVCSAARAAPEILLMHGEKAACCSRCIRAKFWQPMPQCADHREARKQQRRRHQAHHARLQLVAYSSSGCGPTPEQGLAGEVVGLAPNDLVLHYLCRAEHAGSATCTHGPEPSERLADLKCSGACCDSHLRCVATRFSHGSELELHMHWCGVWPLRQAGTLLTDLQRWLVAAAQRD